MVCFKLDDFEKEIVERRAKSPSVSVLPLAEAIIANNPKLQADISSLKLTDMSCCEVTSKGVKETLCILSFSNGVVMRVVVGNPSSPLNTSFVLSQRFRATETF